MGAKSSFRRGARAVCAASCSLKAALWSPVFATGDTERTRAFSYLPPQRVSMRSMRVCDCFRGSIVEATLADSLFLLSEESVASRPINFKWFTVTFTQRAVQVQ